MAKTRIYELAKELGKPSKDILDLLENSGVRGKNHMSALEDNVVRFIKNRFREMDRAERPTEETKADEAETAKAIESTETDTEPRWKGIISKLPPKNPLTRVLVPRKSDKRPERKPLGGWGRAPQTRPRTQARPGTPHEAGRGYAPSKGQPSRPGAGVAPSSARGAGVARTGGAGQGGARPPKSTGPNGVHTAKPMATQKMERPQLVETHPATRPQGAQKEAAPNETRPEMAAQTKPRPEARMEARTGKPIQPQAKTETGPRMGAQPQPKTEAQPGVGTQPQPKMEAQPKPEARPRVESGPNGANQQVETKARQDKGRQDGGRAKDHKGAGAPRPNVKPKPQPSSTRPASERGLVGSREARPQAIGHETSQGPAGARKKQEAARIETKPFKGARRPRPAERVLRETRATGAPTVAARPSRERTKPALRKVALPENITVKDLSERLGVAATDIIKGLMELGVLATINQEIDFDTASIVASEHGIEVERTSEKEARDFGIEDTPDPKNTLLPRPPVVTIMGHVDHGKTSLLDAIRETNVTAQEAGGITQHIGAYQIELKGRKITFIDTPGHEAFTAMRARGAKVTDIAVLVVAADDGVMPQTVEAINHARAAQVPILVAVNKIDKENAQPERVKQQLSEYGLVPDSWGGNTVFVDVSALRKQGIEDLLEMILLVADMQDLVANPNRPAKGTVIEAQLDKGRGPVATVLIEKGTLRVGDAVIVGEAFGRVRAMTNDRGESCEAATPSMPVEVLGLSSVPKAGDILQVVPEERLAKQLADIRQERKRAQELQATQRVSLDDFLKKVSEGETKELRLIVKGDVQGSVEALCQALFNLTSDDVKVNIIHSGVGAINESDVMLASASGAIIIGFQVRPDVNARKFAEREKVDIRLYKIIYDATADVKAAMEGLLEPEFTEVTIGRAEIRQVFRVPKGGTVAGSYVTEGKISRDSAVRLLRDNVVVHEGKIQSLRRFKDDVREVMEGFECGIMLESFQDIREGDIIEAFRLEEIHRGVG